MRENEQSKTVARVKITIEFPLSQPWGEDSDLGQVYKQAKDQALNYISQLRVPYNIIGDAEVTAILIKKDC